MSSRTRGDVVWWLGAALLSLLFGVLTHWQLFEYDLFWQVQAGREILAGHGVQRVDEWSFTAAGKPWFNFQWLATVLDYLGFRIAGGYGGLGWLRSGLVAAWIFTLASLVGRSRRWTDGLILSLLIPWVYVASSFRLQMRPDLYATCLFAALVASWLSSLSVRTKRIAGVGLLLLWANLHAGTFPFGMLFFTGATIFGCSAPKDERLAYRLLWIVVAGSTWLLTPINWHVVSVFAQHMNYDYSRTHNPDFRPFELSLLDYREGGWSILLWVGYTLIAVACTVYLAFHRDRLPIVYRKIGFVVFMEAALTVLSLKNIRALHYQMVFLLPVVASGLRSFLGENRPRRIPASILVVGAGMLWVVIIPDHVQNIARPLGAEVSDSDIPVQSVAFLKRIQPPGKLLNAYPFGGYLIAELPEYPVAIDGREHPFTDFQREENGARLNTQRFAEFLSRWNINIALQTVPSPTYIPQTGVFSDTNALLFPPEEWAQVFFDNSSVVYLRRTEKTRVVIEQHEYRALRRGLPATLGAELKELGPADRAAIESEIERCLVENSRCVYCMIGKAAFAHSRREDEVAITTLEQALKIAPHSAEALLELSVILESLGRSDEAAHVRHRFERLTSRKD